ncbi:hypothetical protein C8255_08695 [filamentous cyanobacterium CCP3]|nr:hypothetical protein C8255_08695 [filamentous cyanobacterium CCP3]
MQLGLSYKRYQLDIPPAVWAEFFDQLTEENRGRLITLKLLDDQLGDFEVLRHTPLYGITYVAGGVARGAAGGDRPGGRGDLVVTVGRPQGLGEATYAHRVVCPQAVSIVTDEDGIVLSCTITNRDQAQSKISFQS